MNLSAGAMWALIIVFCILHKGMDLPQIFLGMMGRDALRGTVIDPLIDGVRSAVEQIVRSVFSSLFHGSGVVNLHPVLVGLGIGG